MEPALPQKLFLLADPILQQKLNQKGNRLDTLLKEKPDDLEVLNDLFLAILSRSPTKQEKQLFVAYRDSKVRDATKTPIADTPPAQTQKESLIKEEKGVRAPVTKAEKRAKAAAKKGALAVNVRRAVFVDTLWALINTTEFIFNH